MEKGSFLNRAAPISSRDEFALQGQWLWHSDSPFPSGTRWPGFESSHGNFYWTIIYYWLFVEQAKINKKRPQIAHFCDFAL